MIISSEFSAPLAILLLGFILGAVLTYLVLRLALRLDFVDRPDGHRKLHNQPTPLGGGVAVFLSLVVVVLVAGLLGPRSARSVLGEHGGWLGSLLASAAVLVVVGVWDDRWGLRGRHKLLGQMAAVAVLVFTGTIVRKIQLFGLDIDLGLLAVPFTFFWLIGAINALNLLDGADGLASTVGIVLAVTVAAMALLVGRFEVAVISLALAGSLLGFFCFNCPPARIYLGDAGSMLIGLVVGVLAIRGSLKGPATIALAAPMAAWTIPILDSTAAVVRRKLTGRSIYASDCGHLHHRLMARFGNKWMTVGVVAVCCAVTGSGAWLSVYTHSDSLALIAMLGVVGVLIATRIFGHVELLHVAREIKSVGKNWATPLHRIEVRANNCAETRLNSSQHWDVMWEALVESSHRFGLVRIRLDVTLPRTDEGYHAFWQRGGKFEAEQLWRTEIPLFSAGSVVGRLVLSGSRNGVPTSTVIEQLMLLVEPFESQLNRSTPERIAGFAVVNEI